MLASVKHDAGRRLALIEGQVSGLRRMVDSDRSCVDILTQIAAVRGALDKLGSVLLVSHVEACVAGKSGKALSRDEIVQEVSTSLSRFLK